MLFRLASILAVSLAAGVFPARGTVFFSDSTFNLGDWSSEEFHYKQRPSDNLYIRLASEPTTANHLVELNQEGTGDTNLQFLANIRSSHTGLRYASFIYALQTSFTYDPALGVIDSLDVYFERQEFEATAVRAILVEQGGTYYRHDLPAGNTAYTDESYLGLTASDFVEALVDPTPNTVVSSHPDFSASGDPINLGLMVGGYGGGLIRRNNVRFDDLEMTLNTSAIPEPALGGLFLAGTAFLWRRRCRKASC